MCVVRRVVSSARAESDLPAALGGDVQVVVARLQVGNVALVAGTRCWHLDQLRQIGHMSARCRPVSGIDCYQFSRVRTWREIGGWAPCRPDDMVRAAGKVKGITPPAAHAREDNQRLSVRLERALNSRRTMYNGIEVTAEADPGEHRANQSTTTNRQHDTPSSGMGTRAAR